MHHHTPTELTPVEMNDLGLRDLARIRKEMSERFEQLGYPGGENLTTSYARVSEVGGRVYGLKYRALLRIVLLEKQSVCRLARSGDGLYDWYS